MSRKVPESFLKLDGDNVDHYLLQSSSSEHGFPPHTPESKFNASTSSTRLNASRSRLYIIGLTCSAILPLIMGLVFYLSLKLNAPNGQRDGDSRFTRPIREGLRLRLDEPDSDDFAYLSPLLVSSVSTSVLGFISPFVVSLFAFHAAKVWYSSSISSQTSAREFVYSTNILQYSGPVELFRSLYYWASNAWSYRSSDRESSKSRKISPTLIFAIVNSLLVFTFSNAMKAVDVVLHDKLLSTNMAIQNSSQRAFPAQLALAPQCRDDSARDPICDVMTRADDAQLGGLNQSESFKVYEAEAPHGKPVSGVAYAGPANLRIGLSLKAHTYAVETTCGAYHPICMVTDLHINSCGPEIADTAVSDYGFNTTEWSSRLQSIIPDPGPVPKTQGGVFNGAVLNPYTHNNFGCFNSYRKIQYDNHDTSSPFIDWNESGQGIHPGNLNVLCSILVCNTTVYDAQYQLSNGSITVDRSSFKKANGSAVFAVSSAAVSMQVGPGDSYYKYAQRFLGDNLQLDLTTVGNKYGNSTSDFSSAFGQAYSNRLLGWSVGAVTMNNIDDAVQMDMVLAISIPLVWAHLFSALHFLYAALIVVAGVYSFILVETSNGKVQKAHEALTNKSIIIEELVAREKERTGGLDSLSTLKSEKEEIERTRIFPYETMDGQMKLSFS